ncbi:alpha/beta hydrolase [Candidatus Roizmanbacteria bacterium]|nr:alpha/beta hydrolase [Candidatus Roizmanbacteria bacterium]
MVLLRSLQEVEYLKLQKSSRFAHLQIDFDIPYAFAEDSLQYSAREEVKNIHKPIMIFIGLNDTVVPPDTTEEIVKNAHNPYIVKLPNVGHDFRHVQGQCEDIGDEIVKFLCST